MSVTFDDLWSNYPADDTAPCLTNGTPNFTDQCAIRFGVCLSGAGVSLSSCRGTCCWFGHGRRHFIRAKQLAEWLNSVSRFGLRNQWSVPSRRGCGSRRVDA